MRLNELSIKNFKGIRDLTVRFDGRDANVYGANEAGKTTLFDAFQWLLFGKDSHDQAKFDVKPLDLEGEAEHNGEHTVSAELDLGDRTLKLKRTLAEKWVKKRELGNIPVLTGHTIKYSIDGVPKSEREFKDIISSICDETTFRLLTNPRYFSESLEWQERRRILIDVCGDISDADVIACDASLAVLPDMLGSRTLEDQRKVLKTRQAVIEKEKMGIPAAIAELQRTISDISNLDIKSIRSGIAFLVDEKQGYERELVNLQNGGEIAKKLKERNEIDAKFIAMENHELKVRQKEDEARQKQRASIQRKVQDISLLIDGNAKRITSNLIEITKLKEQMDVLRDRWMQLDREQFDDSSCSDACPTCGRTYDPDQAETILESARANFNEAKASKLASIGAIGKAKSTEVQRLTEENARLEAENTEKAKAIVEQREALTKLDAPIQEPEPNPERQKLINAKNALESVISEYRLGTHDEESDLKVKIDEAQAKITEQQQILASIDTTKKARDRIDELLAKEKTLSGEFETIEHDLSHLKLFARRKIEMLEGKINERFTMCRFKLFEKQFTGDVSECCEITHNGVPYRSMNNAGQLQAGLDVCRVLAGHYGFTAPVWIDNREGVTEIPEMDCQVISLIVSPEDKVLRFELLGNATEAAA